MTEKELQDYFEEKKMIYTQPEVLRILEERVNYFLALDNLDIATKNWLPLGTWNYFALGCIRKKDGICKQQTCIIY